MATQSIISTPTNEDVERNVQEELEAHNSVDKDENPTGGTVTGKGVKIEWQNGPRGKGEDGELAESNGAFVEDIIWAAKQRLEFFNTSKYAVMQNSQAIVALNEALGYLDDRRRTRQLREVEGQHEV